MTFLSRQCTSFGILAANVNFKMMMLIVAISLEYYTCLKTGLWYKLSDQKFVLIKTNYDMTFGLTNLVKGCTHRSTEALRWLSVTRF